MSEPIWIDVLATKDLPLDDVVAANVVVESTTTTTVTCTLTGGGEAVGFVEAGVPASLTLSVVRNLGAAGNATLTCAAFTRDPGYGFKPGLM